MKEFTIKSPEGKIILFATILASGMAFLDGSIVNIAIPAIQKDLNATITGLQWVVNGYMLMLCALLLISGALGDRFGRKKYFPSVSAYLYYLHSSAVLHNLSNSLPSFGQYRVSAEQ